MPVREGCPQAAGGRVFCHTVGAGCAQAFPHRSRRGGMGRVRVAPGRTGEGKEGSSAMGVEAVSELTDIALEAGVLAKQLGDLVDGVEGGGVVAAAERVADDGK